MKTFKVGDKINKQTKWDTKEVEILSRSDMEITYAEYLPNGRYEYTVEIEEDDFGNEIIDWGIWDGMSHYTKAR